MQGFVVSLSGGADSSAAACLVAQAVELAIDELGWPRFRQRLEHIDALQSDDIDTPEAAVSQLLTCAYQATANSSATTQDAAASLAGDIGATFHTLDVNNLVDEYRQLVEDAIGRRLDWDTDDITLQNIQSRARAPSIWMFANIEQKLLLATSNRSEVAVGYTTMDGDTAGGVSPLAGIDKQFLKHWLRWLETDGPTDTGPVPALSKVTSQTPTAELRPASEDQTDEGDLMPYDVLDAIERAAIRDKYNPIDVFNLLRHRFDHHDAKRLADWVETFFRRWSRNQWKRERYAPTFHLDDENLDPKTWCRFPILSGGYRRELRELREFAASR
jgi:NAD+ synthase (glutamine-hydrolysing)